MPTWHGNGLEIVPKCVKVQKWQKILNISVLSIQCSTCTGNLNHPEMLV